MPSTRSRHLDQHAAESVHEASRASLSQSVSAGVLALVLLVGCAARPAKDSRDDRALRNPAPRIACVFEPTGPVAELDRAALKGAMLAREEAGQVAWGVDVVSVAGAAEAARTSIAAIGCCDSDELRAGYEPFASAAAPFVVVGATDPCLARLPGGDRLSFACYSDAAQGAAMAEFAHEALGARNVAILFEATGDFPIAVSQAFAARSRSLEGMQSTSHAFADPSKIDVAPALATNPDAVYVACLPASVPPAIAALRSTGFAGAILGADSFDLPDIAALTKDATVRFSTHAWFGAGARPSAARFAERYRARYGDEPTAFAALGYDAMQALVRVLESLPSEHRTRQGVAAALRALAPHAGVTGEIAFPSAGHFGAKPVWIVKAGGGGLELEREISPSRVPEPNCVR